MLTTDLSCLGSNTLVANLLSSPFGLSSLLSLFAGLSVTIFMHSTRILLLFCL